LTAFTRAAIPNPVDSSTPDLKHHHKFTQLSVLQGLVSNLFFRSIRFHEDSQYTSVWKYYGVYKIVRSPS